MPSSHSAGARYSRASFPTRRSSDLVQVDDQALGVEQVVGHGEDVAVRRDDDTGAEVADLGEPAGPVQLDHLAVDLYGAGGFAKIGHRSEEHTSELQSRGHLVCPLLTQQAHATVELLSLHDALPISYRWTIRLSVSSRWLATVRMWPSGETMIPVPKWPILANPPAPYSLTTLRLTCTGPAGSPRSATDRKSTRLNSSHVAISYALFSLSRRTLQSSFFPYTTLFRSRTGGRSGSRCRAGGWPR